MIQKKPFVSKNRSSKLTSDAWNVEKFTSAYAARKKLEISGAMALSSAGKQTPITLDYNHIPFIKSIITILSVSMNADCANALPSHTFPVTLLHHTYKNESESDDEGEDVAPYRFIILPVAFSEVFQVWIQFVITKSLENLGCGNQTSQG